MRGAAGDADVILLVTDVYGEALVDERIMTKYALRGFFLARLFPFLHFSATGICSYLFLYARSYRLSMTSRPVIVAINKIDLKPRKASVGTLEEEGLLQHNAVSHTVGGEEDSSEEGYNEDNVDSNSEGDIEDWAEAVKHQQNAEELEGTFDHRRSEYSSRSSSRSSSNSREGGAKRNEQRRQRRAESSGACPVMPLEELRQLWQTRLPNAGMKP